MRGPSQCCLLSILCALALLCGCSPTTSSSQPDLIWGRAGLSDGRFQKPRAITADPRGNLYVVDMTGRIQAFDVDGNFRTSWKTPLQENGRPVGLGIARNGNVLVADTHYYRLLIYSPDGQLVQQIGGEMGREPGQFGFVTDAVQDSQGNYYIGEYGQFDRIQKFSPTGEFLLQFGRHGSEPGEFIRPQGIEIDSEDRIWVADACNHRIQVFSPEGKLLFLWGTAGSEPGQLSYPYGLCFDGQGHVYICEYGNHRVQKFTLDGKPLGSWGTAGRQPGELFNPWGIVRDPQGRLHVLDTNNLRLQRFRL